MDKVFVEPRSQSAANAEATARRLEQLAWLMDRAFKIPGTKISLGLDAIIGLLPVGGDLLTGLVQTGLVLVALRHYRVPKTVAARMMANVLLDIGLGAIPLLGDLFDVAFKANTRNLRLLDPYRAPSVTNGSPRRSPASITINMPPRGTAWRYLVPIAIVLLSALALVLVGLVTVIRWLFQF
jgi:hypothetical protein